MSKPARVISFLMQKGGVGKSSCCINIGAILGKKEFKVCIVDADAQANATMYLGVNPFAVEASIYDALIEPSKHHFDDIILKTQFKNLDLIPSNEDLYGVDLELYPVMKREERLKNFLTPALRKYDYILIDAPPAYSILSINIMNASTEIFIVLQSHPLAYAGLGRLLGDIGRVQEQLNHDVKVTGLILSQHEEGTKACKKVRKKVENDERFSGVLFKTIVRKTTSLVRSTEVEEIEVEENLSIPLGVPIIYLEPDSIGAQDFENLTNEFINVKGSQT